MSSNSSSSLGLSVQLASFCIFVASCFFASQLAVIFLLQLCVEVNLLQLSDLERPLSQLLLLAVVYSLALAAVVFLPRLFDVSSKQSIKKILGLEKSPKIFDLAGSIVGYGVYLALSIALSLIAQKLWHGFNVNQSQETGFQHLSGNFELIVAFIALVLIAPFVEELLFRGYLFGKLRARTGFWLSTILTSVLFGFVHLQWNVGLDVFALSLVLCYLREKTGGVWAGISLHMIKNSIAFVLLFLYPDLVKNLL